MKLKKVVAFMLTLFAAISMPSTYFVSKASELTQASSVDEVAYGSIKPSDAAIIESLFDYDYYKDNNPELVSVIGDSYNDLLKHFLLCGIFEGRTCNPNFNPSAYASAYSDLKDKYGTDIVKYYIHYVEFGKDDDRTITTLAACADAGITVEGLVGENVKISPVVYRLAINMGTTDFAQLQNAFNQIIASEEEQKTNSGSETTNNDYEDNSSVVIETETGIYELRIGGGDTEAYAKAKGLTKIDGVTLSGNNYVSLYLIKGVTGHAVTRSDFGVNTVVYQTADYVASQYGNNSEGMISLSIPPKEDKTNIPINTYDKTNYPYFESKDNVVTTTDQPANEIVSYVGITSPIYVSDDNTSITATDFYLNDRVSTLKGYYTDPEGDEVHEFLSEEDYLSWDASKNPIGSGVFKREPTVYHEYYGKDIDGNSNTVYEIGIEIKSNEDGNIKELSVGVYNDENEFGYVSTTIVPEQNTNN